MSSRAVLAICLLSVSVLGACGDSTTTDDDSGDTGDTRRLAVVAQDISYDTDQLEAEPGETLVIELENADQVAHTFTVEELDFDIEAAPGETPTAEFGAPDEDATLVFFCRFHDSMKGSITIGAGGAGTGDGDLPEDTGEGVNENDTGVDY